MSDYYKHHQHGAIIVEFLLIVPVLLFLVFGFIKIQLYYQQTLAIQTGLSAAISYASRLHDYHPGETPDNTSNQALEIKRIVMTGSLDSAANNLTPLWSDDSDLDNIEITTSHPEDGKEFIIIQVTYPIPDLFGLNDTNHGEIQYASPFIP